MQRNTQITKFNIFIVFTMKLECREVNGTFPETQVGYRQNKHRSTYGYLNSTKMKQNKTT